MVNGNEDSIVATAPPIVRKLRRPVALHLKFLICVTGQAQIRLRGVLAHAYPYAVQSIPLTTISEGRYDRKRIGVEVLSQSCPTNPRNVGNEIEEA